MRLTSSFVRVWTFEEASAALPEVRELVRRVRELLVAARSEGGSVPGNGARASGNGHGPSISPGGTELRAAIDELTSRGIIVRDPERGLIDFPAETDGGRTYLLCWL